MGSPQSAAEPTVSVLIPAFRAASTIDAALASVVAQHRRPEEVIVVDDASDDDVGDRARAWSDRLPIVVLRNERNLGIGGARARAFAEATCDVIAPLDADDVWLPDHLSTLVPLAADERTIVATRTLRWVPAMALGRGDGDDIPAKPAQQLEIMRRNFLFSGSIYPRKPLAAIGKPSASRSVDDWETWIRLIVEAGCVAVPAPAPTVVYRLSTSQASAGEGCLPDEIELLERLIDESEYTEWTDVLERALRVRKARVHLLEGLEHARYGRAGRARASFARAARIDRSIRGGFRPMPHGSVTARAAIGVVSPTLALGGRRALLRRGATADPAKLFAMDASRREAKA